MKKISAILITILLLFTAPAHSTSIYSFTALTGGGTGALDKITGISNGDIAVGIVSGVQYSYTFNASCSDSESSPSKIKPNTDTGCWEIASSFNASYLENHTATYFQVAGSYAADNAATTVNGHTCSLGSSCTVTANLPSNPTACTTGQYVSDIAADGTLTCGTPSGGGDILANGTVPLSADWNVGAHKITASEFATAKTSGTAGKRCIPQANSTDTYGNCDIGPATKTSAYNLNFIQSSTEPSVGQTKIYSAPDGSHNVTESWGTPITLYSTYTAGHIAKFYGTNQIQDGGVLPSGAIVGDTDTQTLTNKTLSEGKMVLTTSGLTQDHVYYMASGGSWTDADSNGSGTYPARCYAISTTQCLLRGVYTKTSHGFTVGANIWLSETAGAVTSTRPATTGDAIQTIGWVLDANTLVINVSMDYGTAP